MIALTGKDMKPQRNSPLTSPRSLTQEVELRVWWEVMAAAEAWWPEVELLSTVESVVAVGR